MRDLFTAFTILTLTFFAMMVLTNMGTHDTVYMISMVDQ